VKLSLHKFIKGVQSMRISEEDFNLLKRTELNILIEFDKVCRKLGISYTLSSGTLLGAVRHKGFIPWDDDIDVAMLREDYNRFISEGQSLLPDNMFIQTYETDENYPNNFCKIRDVSTTLKEYSSKNIDMKTGVYIDVFPIDRVSSNKLIRKFDNYLITAILALKYSCTFEWAMKSSNIVRKIIRVIFFPIVRLIGTRVLNRIETVIRTKNNKECNKLTYGDRYSLPPYRLRDSMLMDIDIFSQYDQVEFEKRKFSVINKKEEYLNIMYGDYMQLPPEEKRIPHHDFYELCLKNEKRSDM